MKRLFLANGWALLLLLNFFLSLLLLSLYFTCLLSPLFSIPRSYKFSDESYIQSPSSQHTLPAHLLLLSPSHHLGALLPSTNPAHPCLCGSGLACLSFPLPLLFPLPSSPIYSSSLTFPMKVFLCRFFKIIVIMKHFNCEYLLSISSVLGNLFALYHLIL